MKALKLWELRILGQDQRVTIIARDGFDAAEKWCELYPDDTILSFRRIGQQGTLPLLAAHKPHRNGTSPAMLDQLDQLMKG